MCIYCAMSNENAIIVKDRKIDVMCAGLYQVGRHCMRHATTVGLTWHDSY